MVALYFIIVTAATPHAFAKNGEYDTEEFELFEDKYKQVFSIDTNPERLCSDEAQAYIAAEVEKGKPREEASATIKRMIGLLRANDAHSNVMVHERNSKNATQGSHSNFITCFTKGLALQRLENGERMYSSLYAFSKSPPTLFSMEGRFSRLGNNSWAIITKADRERADKDYHVLLESQRHGVAKVQQPIVTEKPATGRIMSFVQEINGTEGQVNWNVVTTDKGCIAYLHVVLYFNKNEQKKKAITWNGNCQSGQPISGKGTLTILSAENGKVSWAGQFISGFLNGKATMHSYGEGGFIDSLTYEMGCQKWDSRCSETRPSQAKDAAIPVAASLETNQTNSGKLLPQQISSCSEDIRRTQLESQSWPGDANAVAVRLGKYQKELFEGRCAAHPEAQAYLAGANKMLGYSGAAGSGSNSLSPLASLGGTAGSGSTDSSRTRKVHNPAADAKGCSKLIPSTEWIGKSAMGGNFRFVNNCTTAVEFFWCSDAECDRDSGNTWTIRAGGNWPVSGTNIRWGACRGANSGGFDKGSHGQRYTCPNLTW